MTFGSSFLREIRESEDAFRSELIAMLIDSRGVQ